MHVVLLNHWYDARFASADDLLEAYPTLQGWADALQAEGAEVTVLQRFHREIRHRHHNVSFVLVPDRYGPKIRAWQIPWSFNRAIQKVCRLSSSGTQACAVHFNGLLFPLQLRTLRAALPSQIPIVAQHHGERPWRGVRSSIQRWGLRAADGFFFAASELSSPWVERGMILRDQRVYQVMEGSTTFGRAGRAAARGQTGMSGNPVLLWVGRLIALKDPLTVLNGFERILLDAPNARLYMVYADEHLLREIRLRIESNALLKKSVILLGSFPHSRLKAVYNSADYFVLGSHYEGSGYALAEAMACGVVPVVTDIPSFQVMTGGGVIGACWHPGDSDAFASAFLRVRRQPIEVLSDAAVRFFEEHLSFAAIARKALRAYEGLAAERAGRG